MGARQRLYSLCRLAFSRAPINSAACLLVVLKSYCVFMLEMIQQFTFTTIWKQRFSAYFFVVVLIQIQTRVFGVFYEQKKEASFWKASL